MANYSYTRITLTGHLFPMKSFQEALPITDDIIEADNSTMYIDDIDEVINPDGTVTLQINGTGRWSSPITHIANLAYEHHLTGILTDSEPGNDFFVQITIGDNGINEKATPYFSQLAIDEYGVEFFVDQYSGFLYEADSISDVRDMLELFRANDVDISEWVSQIRKNARSK